MIKLRSTSCVLFPVIALIAIALPVVAQANALDDMLTNLTNIGIAIGLGDKGGDPTLRLIQIAGGIITAFFSLVGIIFVGLMVYAGYLWMTAMGNEEKVEKAKETIVPAIIGVVIIIASYGIATFVLSAVHNAIRSKVEPPKSGPALPNSNWTTPGGVAEDYLRR